MVIYDSTLAIWARFTLVSTWARCCSPFAIFNCKPLLETGAEITNFSLQSVFGLAQIAVLRLAFVLRRWLREVNRYALLQLRSNIYSDGIEMLARWSVPWPR